MKCHGVRGVQGVRGVSQCMEIMVGTLVLGWGAPSAFTVRKYPPAEMGSDDWVLEATTAQAQSALLLLEDTWGATWGYLGLLEAT